MSKARRKTETLPSKGAPEQPAKGRKPEAVEDYEEESEEPLAKNKRKSIKEAPATGSKKQRKVKEEEEEEVAAEKEEKEEQEEKQAVVKGRKTPVKSKAPQEPVKATPKGKAAAEESRQEDDDDPMETPKGKQSKGKKAAAAAAVGSKDNKSDKESASEEGLTEEQYKKLADSWSPEQVKSELLQLHRKYQEILDLRRTQAEELLAEVQANADEKTEVAQKLIAKLKEETKKLIEENALSRSHAQKRAQELEEQLTEANEEIKRLRSTPTKQRKNDSSALSEKLEQLQRITGLTVVSVERGAQTKIQCTQTGLKGVLEFSLTLQDGMCDYTPLNPGALSGQVPDYLEEEIQFEIEQLPLFFWRIIDALQNSDS